MVLNKMNEMNLNIFLFVNFHNFKKSSPTSFSLLTSANIRINAQNFLTFVFAFSPRVLLKRLIFWSKPYKTEVMITSLMEMVESPNFGRMTTSTMYFESLDKTFLVLHMDRNYDVIAFISKYPLC